AVGAKSAAYIPLVSEERVIAVISVATTDQFHAFSNDDLAAMQALASEATIALERTRSALALRDALERERLLASIARRLRTELDLRAALDATVGQTGRAVDGTHCSIELAGAVVAEWGEAGDEEPATSTPIVVHGETVGAVVAHRRPSRPWT